jgi:hypothetical protein
LAQMRVNGSRGGRELAVARVARWPAIVAVMLCASSTALSACRGSQYPSGSIGIHCTDRSNDCDEKMQRACPNGHTTLKVQKLRVKDVAYGQDVLEFTYVITCKTKEDAALPPSDG